MHEARSEDYGKPDSSASQSTTQKDGYDLVNWPEISESDIRYFKQNGFVKIRNLIAKDAIDALRVVASGGVVSAESIGATYDNTFSRLSYSLASADIFRAIYSSAAFKTAMGELIGTRLIATESNGFELTPGREGFPWHIGSLSFRFIRAEDMGYSVWVPLDEIDPDGQGGGMAYVPEGVVSASLNFQLGGVLSEKLLAGESIDETTGALDRLFGFSGELTTGLFEERKVEDSFNVGDVLLFNKNIWHRSSPLKPGPMKSRLAVNMRFMDWRSRLDLTRFHGEADTGGGVGLGVDFGRQKQTQYGSQFTDIKDGDEIRTSRYCDEII